MSEVLVLSAAHTTDQSKWSGLKETAKFWNINLTVTGQKYIPFHGSNDPALFYANYGEGLKVLESAKEEFVMITDSFDALVARWNENEIIDEIEEAGGLLISAEANCFPEGGDWKKVYDAKFGIKPWRYCNGGQYCGRRSQVISLLREMWERMGKTKFNGQSNEILHDLFVEDYPFQLDVNCKVFQSMFTHYVSNVTKGAFGVFNSMTLTYPMMMHFNGCAPGIEGWKKYILTEAGK